MAVNVINNIIVSDNSFRSKLGDTSVCAIPSLWQVTWNNRCFVFYDLQSVLHGLSCSMVTGHKKIIV